MPPRPAKDGGLKGTNASAAPRPMEQVETVDLRRCSGLVGVPGNTRAGQRSKLPPLRIVVEDHALLDVEHPTADEQLSSVQAFLHAAKGTQVFELRQDVLLGGCSQLRGSVEVRVFLLNDFLDALCLFDPAPNEGKTLHGFRPQHRVHRSALGVAADDHVLHLEDRNGVLDGSRSSTSEADLWDHVPDVPHNEQLTGLGVGDERRDDPGIAAADTKGFRPLPPTSQLLEELLMRGEVVALKLVKALDELLHQPWM